MPALDRLYTWKLTDTELERLEPAERYAVELVAAIEPHVRAYLTASIHDPDERREAIADSVAEAFGAVGPKSTIESTRAAALRRARERSKECKARERYVDGRACVDTMSLSARDRDAVADCRYRLELWTWIEPTLALLRDGERIAFESYVAGDRSDAEIAAELACAVPTVRKLRQRAKTALRGLIKRGVVPSFSATDAP